MKEHGKVASYRTPALADSAALIGRLECGDESALRAVVDALWRPLVSYATWLLDDADAASDVVQDALTHVWLARDHLTIRTSLEAYLYRSVHNRALDERRRTTRRRRLLERRALHREGDSESVPAVAARLPAILERALASLPERRRQIFILAHLHDLTYRQIAQILELSPQTIANHVSMALADLRRKLAPHAAALVTDDEVAGRIDRRTSSAG